MIGHNSQLQAAAHLKQFIERVERLEEDKASITGDIKDVYAEAKANGFDVPTMRKIVSLRKMDRDKRMEQEQILETYMHALGMLSDTPLGEEALKNITITKAKP
jgi:uncharacterized protein (UPF0335 family)